MSEVKKIINLPVGIQAIKKINIMRKITLILAFIGMITLQSCSNDKTDNNTISEVFELRNINFGFDAQNGYTIYQTLNPQIRLDDVILIYRLSGTIDPSTPIWQQIPRPLYLSQGELDYDFDFSLTPNYITNQTFRIVIIPGYLSNKMKSSIDLSDYNAVVNAFHIDPSKIKVLNK